MKSAVTSWGVLVSRAGFSLMELLVVVAITLVVVGLSIPSFDRAFDNAKLKAASQQLAAFYQQARIRATQDNTYYQLVTSAPGVVPARMCLDLDGNGTCDAGEPSTQFPSRISVNNNGVPVLLDAAKLRFAPLNTENSSMYDQQNKLVAGLAWNARGLPCQRISSTSACANSIPAAVGWVQYLQLQRSIGDVVYAAVTVSPSGRVKIWTYSPASTGNGNWF